MSDVKHEPMLRAPEVINVTGLSRGTIYRLMKIGTFPRAIKLSTHAIGWEKSAITAWLSARKSQTAQ